VSKRRPLLIDTVSSLIVLYVLFLPFPTDAGTFYSCVDKEGNEVISDYPLSGRSCNPVATFKDETNQERMNQEAEREAKEERRTEEYEKKKAYENARRNLYQCFQAAAIRYQENWDSNCVSLGLPRGCSLPPSSAQRWDYKLEQWKSQCLQLYPQRP